MTTAITSRDHMEQAFEKLQRLYQSLAAVRRQIEPANPRNFAVLAEGSWSISGAFGVSSTNTLACLHRIT